MARAQKTPDDPLLRRTRQTARAIMRDIKHLPKARRMSRLQAALASYEPSLPTKVQALADKMYQRGANADQAVEEALTLALADASIDVAQSWGRKVHGSETFGMGGLGSLSGAEDQLKDLATSLACSEELQRTASEKAGESKGRDAYLATLIGFKAAKSAVKCPETSREDLTKPPPSSPTPSDNGDTSLAVPIVVGVGVLGLAGIALWYMKSH